MSKTSNGKGGAAVAGAARGSAYARNDSDGYLQAEVEGRELVIRIGVDRLAYCLRTDDGPMHGCKIRSKYGAAKDMARMMERDDEIGQTPIGTFLDEMAKAAAEDGSIHVSMPNTDVSDLRRA